MRTEENFNNIRGVVLHGTGVHRNYDMPERWCDNLNLDDRIRQIVEDWRASGGAATYSAPAVAYEPGNQWTEASWGNFTRTADMPVYGYITDPQGVNVTWDGPSQMVYAEPVTVEYDGRRYVFREGEVRPMKSYTGQREEEPDDGSGMEELDAFLGSIPVKQ
jgi:hypothetical protein